MYIGLKYFHIVFVSLSIVLFQYRYFLKTINRPVTKPLRVIPHINDTLLLISGVSMAFIAGFNPMAHPWLLAKLVALLLYIIFGMLAFKTFGRKSLLAYLLATLTFVFLVFTAIYKVPFLIGT